VSTTATTVSATIAPPVPGELTTAAGSESMEDSATTSGDLNTHKSNIILDGSFVNSLQKFTKRHSRQINVIMAAVT